MNATRLLVALFLSLPAALAMSATTLQVVGRIPIQPCVISIGGTLNYGWISAARLNMHQPTALDARRLNFQISCPGPRRVGLSFKDNYAATRVDGLSAGDIGAHFGLAMSRGYRVGAIALEIDNSRESHDSLQEIRQTQQTWQASNGAVKADILMAWRRTQDHALLGPGSFRLVAGDLVVTPVIVARRELPLANEISASGHITSELHYL